MLKTIVVVGSGAAGIGAALTLVDKSYRIILLEKGASMFGAQGLFAVGSKYQTEIDYTVADAYKKLVDYTHHGSNSRISRRSWKNQLIQLTGSINTACKQSWLTTLKKFIKKSHELITNTLINSVALIN